MAKLCLRTAVPVYMSTSMSTNEGPGFSAPLWAFGGGIIIIILLLLLIYFSQSDWYVMIYNCGFN